MGSRTVNNANAALRGMSQDAKDAMRALQGCRDVMWKLARVSPQVGMNPVFIHPLTARFPPVDG